RVRSAVGAQTSGFAIAGPVVARRAYEGRCSRGCKSNLCFNCEYRGKEVVLRGMSDGLIQWPSTRRRGAYSPILCGDLIRAVERESAIAVSHHWGVRGKTVGKWRRALSVPAMTHGTRRLLI